MNSLGGDLVGGLPPAANTGAGVIGRLVTPIQIHGSAVLRILLFDSTGALRVGR